MDFVIDQIRERMIADGRTQAAFAADLGISQKHLSEVFNGWSNASYDLLDKMLEMLGCELVLVTKVPR